MELFLKAIANVVNEDVTGEEGHRRPPSALRGSFDESRIP